MAASTIAFIAMSFTVPRRNRIFHYSTAGVTLVASIAYFIMASNLSYAAIAVEFQRSNPKVSGFYREIFYVRYINWFVTTLLLLLDLLLTAGLPWPTIIYTILLDEVMVVTGLVGALVASSYKWGYFLFATVALFFIAWNATWVARKHAAAIGPNVSRTFLTSLLLPIPKPFYGILDILAKPVFGAMLLIGHRNIDPATLSFHIRDYDDDMHPTEESGFRSAAAANNNTGVVNGSHNTTTHATANPTVATDNTTTGTSGVTGTYANQFAV
ncbi:hypothetical protein G7Y89_g11388 [Cudoniella acicularis]|uniref:Family A G protein-coupled receptor-like protein n=1 Tax=Cudoniella acicularis TaxID=354080 RepID=A0A8H4RC24_9HELO|nr:hypothetical protein G7Y89_g11388 [Cudoniella acicularis]